MCTAKMSKWSVLNHLRNGLYIGDLTRDVDRDFGIDLNDFRLFSLQVHCKRNEADFKHL